MEFKNFPPSDILKPYIKYYWLCTTDEDVSMEVMFPSGHVELCFDISNGNAIRYRGDQSIEMPKMEVLGHLTIPTTASVKKGTTVLIARFYPYAFSLFFPNPVSDFNDASIDLHDILNRESDDLYNRMMEQHSIEQKIKTIEAFLAQLLLKNDKKLKKFQLVEGLCNQICKRGESFDLTSLSSHYGFSERYIQKLFLDWVGLTPKSFHRVKRFNESLELIQTSSLSHTSIAYECGYYDQAHFIKEFKSYTGMTPWQAALLG